MERRKTLKLIEDLKEAHSLITSVANRQTIDKNEELYIKKMAVGWKQNLMELSAMLKVGEEGQVGDASDSEAGKADSDSSSDSDSGSAKRSRRSAANKANRARFQEGAKKIFQMLSVAISKLSFDTCTALAAMHKFTIPLGPPISKVSFSCPPETAIVSRLSFCFDVLVALWDLRKDQPLYILPEVENALSIVSFLIDKLGLDKTLFPSSEIFSGNVGGIWDQNRWEDLAGSKQLSEDDFFLLENLQPGYMEAAGRLMERNASGKWSLKELDALGGIVDLLTTPLPFIYRALSSIDSGKATDAAVISALVSLIRKMYRSKFMSESDRIAVIQSRGLAGSALKYDKVESEFRDLMSELVSEKLIADSVRRNLIPQLLWFLVVSAQSTLRKLVAAAIENYKTLGSVIQAFRGIQKILSSKVQVGQTEEAMLLFVVKRIPSDCKLSECSRSRRTNNFIDLVSSLARGSPAVDAEFSEPVLDPTNVLIELVVPLLKERKQYVQMALQLTSRIVSHHLSTVRWQPDPTNVLRFHGIETPPDKAAEAAELIVLIAKIHAESDTGRSQGFETRSLAAKVLENILIKFGEMEMVFSEMTYEYFDTMFEEFAWQDKFLVDSLLYTSIRACPRKPQLPRCLKETLNKHSIRFLEIKECKDCGHTREVSQPCVLDSYFRLATVQTPKTAEIMELVSQWIRNNVNSDVLSSGVLDTLELASLSTNEWPMVLAAAKKCLDGENLEALILIGEAVCKYVKEGEAKLTTKAAGCEAFAKWAKEEISEFVGGKIYAGVPVFPDETEPADEGIFSRIWVLCQSICTLCDFRRTTKEKEDRSSKNMYLLMDELEVIIKPAEVFVEATEHHEERQPRRVIAGNVGNPSPAYELLNQPEATDNMIIKETLAENGGQQNIGVFNAGSLGKLKSAGGELCWKVPISTSMSSRGENTRGVDGRQERSGSCSSGAARENRDGRMQRTENDGPRDQRTESRRRHGDRDGARGFNRPRQPNRSSFGDRVERRSTGGRMSPISEEVWNRENSRPRDSYPESSTLGRNRSQDVRQSEDYQRESWRPRGSGRPQNRPSRDRRDSKGERKAYEDARRLSSVGGSTESAKGATASKTLPPNENRRDGEGRGGRSGSTGTNVEGEGRGRRRSSGRGRGGRNKRGKT